MVAQLIDGRLYVASPVALLQDMIFVVIQCCDLPGHPSDMFSEEGDDAQDPYRCFDAYPPRTAQLLMNQVAEGARLIHLSVAEEIFTSGLSVVDG